jgi:hypothetical protein
VTGLLRLVAGRTELVLVRVVPACFGHGLSHRLIIELDLSELEALYEARLDAFVRTAAAITGERDSGRDAVHDALRGRSKRFRLVGRLWGE